MGHYNLKRQPRQLPNGDIEIPLTKGHVTVISAESADVTNRLWLALRTDKQVNRIYAASNAVINGKTVTTLLHRLVMELALGRTLLKSEDIDHINGDELDNRLSNLRVATRSQNLANSKRSKSNTTGFKGVRYNKQTQRYHAHIRINGKDTDLGDFAYPEEAYFHYCKTAREIWGEFARFD